MADAFNATTGAGNAFAGQAVQPAYDLLYRWALNVLPQYRQFVDVRPANPAMSGSSITIEQNQYFSEAAVTAAKTPLNELLDVEAVAIPAPLPVVLTPLEYGFANVRTLKLVNRTMVPVDPIIAQAVADHQRKVVDSLIQDKLAAATNLQYQSTAVSPVTTTKVMTLTADSVRQAVLKLRTASAVPWFGDLYACGIHPSATYELRRETGNGAWRLPNEYGVSQENIWNGEIGAFEGVRFVENARTRVAADGALASGVGTDGTNTLVARTYFFGKEALAEAVVVEPHVVLGPQVDRLQRFQPIGWYGDLDFKIFRNPALVLNYSGSATFAAAIG